VTGWMAMAVKSAKISGLKLPDDIFDSIRTHCFNSIPENKETSDYSKEDPTLNYANATPMTNRKGPAMTAIGMLLRMYTGSSSRSHGVVNGANKLLKILPKWGGNSGIPEVNVDDLDSKWNNEYTWYYGTLTMFQVGGEHWKVWNKALIDTLIPNQRKGGPLDGSLKDVDGSWDTGPGWSPIVGRSYMTAMCALNLEVYYRYESISKN